MLSTELTHGTQKLHISHKMCGHSMWEAERKNILPSGIDDARDLSK